MHGRTTRAVLLDAAAVRRRRRYRCPESNVAASREARGTVTSITVSTRNVAIYRLLKASASSRSLDDVHGPSPSRKYCIYLLTWVLKETKKAATSGAEPPQALPARRSGSASRRVGSSSLAVCEICTIHAPANLTNRSLNLEKSVHDPDPDLDSTAHSKLEASLRSIDHRHLSKSLRRSAPLRTSESESGSGDLSRAEIRYSRLVRVREGTTMKLDESATAQDCIRSYNWNSFHVCNL